MTLAAPTPRPHLPQTTAPHLALDATTFILEAILTAPADQPITVPGWTIRAWPVARLGDATLEAHAQHPHLGPADLHTALRTAGITPLGPIRPRHT